MDQIRGGGETPKDLAQPQQTTGDFQGGWAQDLCLSERGARAELLRSTESVLLSYFLPSPFSASTLCINIEPIVKEYQFIVSPVLSLPGAPYP